MGPCTAFVRRTNKSFHELKRRELSILYQSHSVEPQAKENLPCDHFTESVERVQEK